MFEWIEEKPLGSASIGQVHRARLRGSGREVAVKVQYPAVEELFRGDIATIRTFCQIAQPEHLSVLDEARTPHAPLNSRLDRRSGPPQVARNRPLARAHTPLRAPPRWARWSARS